MVRRMLSASMPSTHYRLAASPLPNGTVTNICRHGRIPWGLKSLLLRIVVGVQSPSCAQLFVTPRTAALQAPLSFTISQILLKFIFTESVLLPDHVILCHPLLLMLSNITVFSNESTLQIRWPKYWSFSFSNSPVEDYCSVRCLKIRLSLQVDGELHKKVKGNTDLFKPPNS